MPAIHAEHKAHTAIYSDVNALVRKSEEKNVCSVVAVAFACGVTYDVSHKAHADAGRKEGKATPIEVTFAAIKALGGKMKEVVKQDIIDTFPAPHDTLSNLTLHHPVRFRNEWPDGIYIAFSKGHVSTVIDGDVHDWARGTARRITALYEVKMPEVKADAAETDDAEQKAA